MRNVLLEKIVKLFLKVMLIFSVYLLFRGHNNPGGGFISGIIASTGFIFYAIIFGTGSVKKMIGLSSRKWMGVGLLVILTTAIVPVFFSKAVLTSLWFPGDFPILGALHIGTPLLFDSGVFLVVSGMILTIVISIMEVLEWN